MAKVNNSTSFVHLVYCTRQELNYDPDGQNDGFPHLKWYGKRQMHTVNGESLKTLLKNAFLDSFVYLSESL